MSRPPQPRTTCHNRIVRARRPYEARKARLHAELLKDQLWAQETGQKFVLQLQGRDAGGKGGSINRFTEDLNPRSARVDALNKPWDVQKSRLLFQRHVEHVPIAGEIVLYDR